MVQEQKTKTNFHFPDTLHQFGREKEKQQVFSQQSKRSRKIERERQKEREGQSEKRERGKERKKRDNYRD